MKFKTGQKVVCTKRGLWDDQLGNLVKAPIEYNHIYTIAWCGSKGFVMDYVELIGIFGAFREDCFEPIITDDQLYKELETIEQFL